MECHLEVAILHSREAVMVKVQSPLLLDGPVLEDMLRHPLQDRPLVLILSELSAVIRTVFCSQSKRRLWNWFSSVDSDRSGSISASELQQALVNGDWSRASYHDSVI